MQPITGLSNSMIGRLNSVDPPSPELIKRAGIAYRYEAAFIIVAGWLGRHPGQSTVGGVSTAYKNRWKATILNAPLSWLDTI